MSKTTTRVADRHGGSQHIETEQVPTTGGRFVVHGRLQDDGTLRKRGAWDVTHVATGKRVNQAPFATKQQALEVARTVVTMADWDALDADAPSPTVTFGPKVCADIMSVCRWGPAAVDAIANLDRTERELDALPSLPGGWEWHDPAMGMDALLVCPCGDVIEQDGVCPDGCESPLSLAGMV